MREDSLDNLSQESVRFKISNTTLSTDQKIKLMELACNLPPGISKAQDWEAYYKKMAELITGTIGPVNEESTEKSNPRHRPGTTFGDFFDDVFSDDGPSEQELTVNRFEHGYCTIRCEQKNFTFRTEDLQSIYGQRVQLEKAENDSTPID